MSPTSPSEKTARRLVEGCALAAGGVALLAVLVRVVGQWSPWVASYRSFFSIAPHTASMLCLLGIALFAHNRWPHRRGSRILVTAVLVSIGAACFAALTRPWLPIKIEFESWFVGLAAPTAGARIGHLSPHTAWTFLCAGAALGCLLHAPETGWRRRVAFILAAMTFASASFAALGFAVGTPLLYGKKFPTMMWLSAALFVVLATGLMFSAFPRNWLLQGLTAGRKDNPDAPSHKFRRALVILLAFLTGGIGTAGFYFLRKEQANLRSRVEQELAAVANVKVAQVADWRRERLKEANLMFHTPYAARRALDALAEPASQKTREMFTGWLEPFLATGPYAEALVLDPKLNVGLVHPANGHAVLFEDEVGPAKDALRVRQPVVTDLHRPADQKDAVYLSLIVPIVVRKEGDRDAVPAAGLPPSANDRSAALLVLRIDANNTLYPLLKTWPTASLSAETILVRRDRNDCIYASELRYETNSALRMRIPMSRTNAPAVVAALGKERVLKGFDYRNMPVLAVTRKVPNSPWSLVAKMDEEEIYAPVRERGRTLGVILVVLIVAVTLGLNLIWRQRDVEFLRQQVATERERSALAQRLAHVLKHANDIIVMSDNQWRILEVNDRALEAYGYTLAEMKKMHSPDLRAPETRSDFAAFAEKFRIEGQIILETVHQRKDGSTFPVEISTRKVDIDGNIHSFAVIRDITERKRAEEAVRQSEEKYRVLFEAAAEGVAVADLSTKSVLYANRAYCLMFGYSPEELLHLRVEELHPPESRAIVMSQFETQARGAESPAVDTPCQRKDGSIFYAAINARPAVIAGRPVLVGFFTDVTDRKRSEEALRESEERFRMLAESSLAGIYLFQNHRFIYVNPALATIFGYQTAELIGRLGPKDLTHPEDHALLAENVRRRLEEGLQQVRYEFRGRRKDGTILRVEALGARIDYQGQPAILGTLLDITEKKQLEAQFLRAQRLEGIGALAGGIAHDLNNILAPILMSTSLLRETVTDPESRSMLATMATCAQRGADIIKQLLTFARGKPGARVPLPVRHLLRDMEKIIRETFPRNIQPNISAPDNLWPVLGDATQIHQAIMNLCVNARDAMPNGGSLTVTATNVTLDEITASSTPDAKAGPYVSVSVTDTGTGIAPEDLDRIFDPFFTTKEIGKGTGLGLPTVLGIVRGHEGFVRVNSRPGNGTTMEIFLRASPEAKVARSAEAEIMPPRGQGELVLVVDDEASVRTVVQRTLETHGYRVLTAAEGHEGLRLFAQYDGQINVVLTDMMMPGMEGPELIRVLHSLAPNLPVIGMTGLAQRAGVKGVEQLNLPVLLVKPFRGAKLLSALHEALTGKSQKTPATTGTTGQG